MKASTLARFILASVCALAWIPSGYAQGGGAGGGVSVTGGSGGVGDGFLFGSNVFLYSDNSTLGSNTLRDGGAQYLRFNAQYNMTDWFSGLGAFYEMDSFGEDQSDTIMGLVIELVAGNVFVKIMPGQVSQTFSNRSFTARSGSYMGYEGGIRANLFEGILYYEVTLHSSTKTITTEDSRTMKDVYAKAETFPMLGMGINL